MSEQPLTQVPIHTKLRKHSGNVSWVDFTKRPTQEYHLMAALARDDLAWGQSYDGTRNFSFCQLSLDAMEMTAPEAIHIFNTVMPTLGAKHARIRHDGGDTVLLAVGKGEQKKIANNARKAIAAQGCVR